MMFLLINCLQACNTTAVFQLESRISRDLIKRFKPDCFTDLVALVAIIRPGFCSLECWMSLSIAKNGRSRITYLHPSLSRFCARLMGWWCIKNKLCRWRRFGRYSLGSADLLRRAMGKKKPEEMALQRAIFIEGAAKNNIDKHLANIIFDLMEKFASYGFNKSHSCSLCFNCLSNRLVKGALSCEFMAAVLSSDMDNTDKVVLYLNDCKKMNLAVVPPDINKSNYQFTVTATGEILYGLGRLKGWGRRR